MHTSNRGWLLSVLELLVIAIFSVSPQTFASHDNGSPPKREQFYAGIVAVNIADAMFAAISAERLASESAMQENMTIRRVDYIDVEATVTEVPVIELEKPGNADVSAVAFHQTTHRLTNELEEWRSRAIPS